MTVASNKTSSSDCSLSTKALKNSSRKNHVWILDCHSRFVQPEVAVRIPLSWFSTVAVDSTISNWYFSLRVLDGGRSSTLNTSRINHFWLCAVTSNRGHITHKRQSQPTSHEIKRYCLSKTVDEHLLNRPHVGNSDSIPHWEKVSVFYIAMAGKDGYNKTKSYAIRFCKIQCIVRERKGT